MNIRELQEDYHGDVDDYDAEALDVELELTGDDVYVRRADPAIVDDDVIFPQPEAPFNWRAQQKKLWTRCVNFNTVFLRQSRLYVVAEDLLPIQEWASGFNRNADIASTVI